MSKTPVIASVIGRFLSLVLILNPPMWVAKVTASTGTVAAASPVRDSEPPVVDAQATDLWVDAVDGSDSNNGSSAEAAFRTIQKAASLAAPGATVHILPGVYRESITPAQSGTAVAPIVYRAENGLGTVSLRGSESSASLTWVHGTADVTFPTVARSNIWYTDLSVWNLSAAPRFVVQLDNNGQVIARLPLARAPNWTVTTDWKYAENWWTAEGGSVPAACDPVTNANHDCDYAQRSWTQLTDRTNLPPLGDLTGGTLRAQDTKKGHSVYRRTITADNVGSGTITVNSQCEIDGSPGLGWGSKYYVEGKPQLLDIEGEWWYDAVKKRLYLWAPGAVDPATLNIEISRRDTGFALHNRSYLTLDGLTIEFFNGIAVDQGNGISEKSYHNTVRNALLRYSNQGVWIEQDISTSYPSDRMIDGFTLENSEIAYMDTRAIRLIQLWFNGYAAGSFTRSGLQNIVIRNNELHHLGFRSDYDNADGAVFTFADKLRFEGNQVHDVAHIGVLFDGTVVQSSKTYGFAPSEIKTGDILIFNNTFTGACQLATDCGAVKFWGWTPQNHVYRNVLITGNIFREAFGWTYVSEKRQLPFGGEGLFVDQASGIHAYRNIAYNNGLAGYYFIGTWRDGDIIYYNNVAANSKFGIALLSPGSDTHGNVNTQISDNIIVNNEDYGMVIYSASGNYANLTINHNLYYSNGWSSGGVYKPGDMVTSFGFYTNVQQIQLHTPWEAQGVEGDPAFWSYDVNDHNAHDSSWPDFHLTAASTNAIDRGVTALPASLTALLNEFGVADWYVGSAYDIGRYEVGFALTALPSFTFIDPGGTAQHAVSVFPPDLPYGNVVLTFANPAPSYLTVTLGQSSLPPGGTTILMVTDHHSSPLSPGLFYTVPITGTSGGFTDRVDVQLLVGGTRIYLPHIAR